MKNELLTIATFDGLWIRRNDRARRDRGLDRDRTPGKKAPTQQ